MKVQCEQCGAAYSVADEKVAGRKLKQRCRKCGTPMIIDGTAAARQAELSEEAVSVDSPAVSEAAIDTEAVWHIAVGDTTQGPYALDELAQYYADGSVVLDTLVCRDGWSDWRPASEVPELLAASRSLSLASLPPPPPPSRSSTPPAVPAHALGQAVAMGSDPFGEPVELSPRVSSADMATPGMQSDGTVQFSMDQIRALSAVSSPSLAQPQATLTGYATGDDSGLIDMGALAEAEAEAAARAPGASAYRQLTPSLIGPMQGLTPLTLAAVKKPGVDFRTKVAASVAAFAIVLIGTVSVLALQRSSDASESIAQAQPASLPAVVAVAAAAEVPAAAAAQPAPAGQVEDDREEGSEASSSRSSRKRGRSGRHGGSSARGDDAKSDSGDVDRFLAGKPAAPKKGSIDDLLLGALNGKKSAPKEEPSADRGSSLPQTPSREQMLSSLGKAKAKAAKCKGSGVAIAAITVAGKSGKAKSVSVSGVDGAAKSCVEKAVRSTSFPKFQKDSFDVKFPFKIGG